MPYEKSKRQREDPTMNGEDPIDCVNMDTKIRRRRSIE
tara:strand:- start:262 stop:375 length:114 start_codon:yes stop_codon:yes gene_type:complete